MTTPQIQFDAERHVYTVDGTPYPSVTTILKDAGLIDTSAPWYTQEARDKGTYVHTATQYHDEGDLDPETIDPEIVGYVDAWEKFRAASKIEILHIELPVCNTTCMYAGMIDRVVMWSKIKTVIDIKAGQPEDWHALQTAAYAACLPGCVGRATVYLSKDGKYRVSTHESITDFDVFACALAVANWKNRRR